MAIYNLIDDIIFPPTDEAEEDGLLAIGGDLSPQRILYALSIGIFPWFNIEDPILWWAPDPRFVVFPNHAKISKSLKKSYKNFDIKINHNFYETIKACANTKRKDGAGTWICNEIIKSYTKLHELGWGYSFETYKNNKLVGGLYGVLLNKVFIGESMFSTVTDASKSAFYELIKFCITNNIKIIDCQFHTSHLESLGGEYISREKYSEYLSNFGLTY